MMRGSTRELMNSCGVARAAEEAGAELVLPEEEGWEAFFEDQPVCGSHWKSGIMMPKIINEVDHIVLLPRCSRHVLAGSTLGMKAADGYPARVSSRCRLVAGKDRRGKHRGQPAREAAPHPDRSRQGTGHVRPGQGVRGRARYRSRAGLRIPCGPRHGLPGLADRMQASGSRGTDEGSPGPVHPPVHRQHGKPLGGSNSWGA